MSAFPYRAGNRLRDYTYGHRARTACAAGKWVEPTKDAGYWRDVGNLDAYWNANMDLCGVDPYFNLYGELWPIHSYIPQLPAGQVRVRQRAGGRTQGGQGPGLFGQAWAALSAAAWCATRCWRPKVVVQSWAQGGRERDHEQRGHRAPLPQSKRRLSTRTTTCLPGTMIGLDPRPTRSASR